MNIQRYRMEGEEPSDNVYAEFDDNGDYIEYEDFKNMINKLSKELNINLWYWIDSI